MTTNYLKPSVKVLQKAINSKQNTSKENVMNHLIHNDNQVPHFLKVESIPTECSTQEIMKYESYIKSALEKNGMEKRTLEKSM